MQTSGGVSREFVCIVGGKLSYFCGEIEESYPLVCHFYLGSR